MAVDAENVALANEAVLRTFEQCCVTWRAIPHWDTQNPGQTRVRRDTVFAFSDPTGSHRVTEKVESFEIGLAQATAPSPDPLLGAVIAATVRLAAAVDGDVLPTLAAAAHAAAATHEDWYRQATLQAPPAPAVDIDTMLGALLDGRDLLEDHGYRARSCLLAGTEYHRALNRLVGGVLVADELLRAGAVGAAYRAGPLDGATDGPLMIMIGRRQDMPGGSATAASAGEEPVDLAVSVPPGLEVVGETADGRIELAVRVRYALRQKDDHGVVVFHR